MPGSELFGMGERKAVKEIFDINSGILFAQGFDKARKGVYGVSQLEKAFAERVSIGHAQAASAGPAALYTALTALGLREGDELIT